MAKKTDSIIKNISKKKSVEILIEKKPYEQTHFIDTKKSVWNYSLFTDEDISNFKKGTHYKLYNVFGNKQIKVLRKRGTYFSVWAPNATFVSVIGEFNDWKVDAHPLFVRLDKSGIWEGFIPNVSEGVAYKYHIHGYNAAILDKGDPFAHYWERRPKTASITKGLQYKWKDKNWLNQRKKYNSLQSPYSVYEVHLASWMRPDKNNEDAYTSYIELIDRLVPYVKNMGFTHVELMPVMEHPYDGSWGYQGIGFFAPTCRFGTPQDFMALIDAFHKEKIAVILDWVPSHFPHDAHGLYMFDGTHTYEYEDRRKGFHPDWNSYIFNYARGEVKSFLISSARFWIDQFHIDGLRVDAVSSMLRLDYSRKEGEWEPNVLGGNGNLEAIEFIKDLNETLYRDFPDIQTIAEEATDWPKISKPTTEGGLGFGMKWMMGWMHDTLNYFKREIKYRKFHQNDFTFSMMYFYDENFMLPLSHDEVVHGKSPMIYKMPGDEWQKFANLRLLYTYMFTHPGAKLLFMGNEFGQTNEWDYTSELQWELLQYDCHNKLQHCVRDLCHLLKTHKALYINQFDEKGFEWNNLNHRDESVVSFLRKGNNRKDDVLVILNLTQIPRLDWKVEVFGKKNWQEKFNSDYIKYWGTGSVINKEIEVKLLEKRTKKYQLSVQLPPLSGIVLV